MDRRTAVKSVLLAGTGALAGAGVPARSSTAIPRVAYHLSDTAKAGFVLGNIRNHIDGMGGPGTVSIALVVHGPPLAVFRADGGNDGIKEQVSRLRGEGVEFLACIHTMEGMKLGLSDLLPGFAVAEKGGVVKLAQLQAEGWLYLRP